MPALFDPDQLEKLAKNFYNLSHTMISVYDSDYKLLISYPEKMSDFCTLVRSSDTLARRCREHDCLAFEQCRKTRSLYVYHCHMGLLEVAFPIISNHLIIGYMLFGQLCDEKNRDSLVADVTAVAEEFGLDSGSLIAGLRKIRYRSPEYIESISNLMVMSADYIWLNNIIKVGSGGLAFSARAYILANLQGDLSVKALCSELGISRSALYALAKEHFGCGISEYVAALRIEAAEKLLNGGCNVSETAERVGYRSADTFIRAFRNITGQTPKQYQTGFGKQNRKNGSRRS